MVSDENVPTIRADYLGQASLALIGELETSLEAGERALLMLDWEETQRITKKQIPLYKALEATLFSPPITETAKLQSLERLAGGVWLSSPELAGRLRTAADRVLQRARLQAALLRRSQEFLRVLTNCIASPEAVYGPPGCSAESAIGAAKCRG